MWVTKNLSKVFLSFGLVSGYCYKSYSETILYFHTSPGDSELSTVSKKRAQTIRDCGYQVIENSDFGSDKWKTFIENNKNSKPKMVFIEGHGFKATESFDDAGWQFLLMRNPSGFAGDIKQRSGQIAAPIKPETKQNKEGRITHMNDAARRKLSLMNEFERLQFFNPGVVEDGDKLIASIDSNFPNSKLWIDTCYAGACGQCKSIGVGTACSDDERSYNKSQLSDGVIELLCSAGPKGNCEKWNAVDTNGDGIISSKELRVDWQKKHPATAKKPKPEIVRTHLTKEELSKVMGEGVKIVSLSDTKPATIIVRDGKGRLIFNDEGFPITTEGTRFEINEVEKITGLPLPKDLNKVTFESWKKQVIEVANSKYAFDLARSKFDFIPKTYSYEVTREIVLEPFDEDDKKKLQGGISREINKTVSPQLRGFQLNADRCTKNGAHNKSNQPGLTGH